MTEIAGGVVTVITGAFAFVGGLVAQSARTKRQQTAGAGEVLRDVLDELGAVRGEHRECIERATRLEVRLARVESRVGMPHDSGARPPAAG